MNRQKEVEMTTAATAAIGATVCGSTLGSSTFRSLIVIITGSHIFIRSTHTQCTMRSLNLANPRRPSDRWSWSSSFHDCLSLDSSFLLILTHFCSIHFSSLIGPLSGLYWQHKNERHWGKGAQTNLPGENWTVSACPGGFHHYVNSRARPSDDWLWTWKELFISSRVLLSKKSLISLMFSFCSEPWNLNSS